MENERMLKDVLVVLCEEVERFTRHFPPVNSHMLSYLPVDKAQDLLALRAAHSKACVALMKLSTGIRQDED